MDKDTTVKADLNRLRMDEQAYGATQPCPENEANCGNKSEVNANFAGRTMDQPLLTLDGEAAQRRAKLRQQSNRLQEIARKLHNDADRLQRDVFDLQILLDCLPHLLPIPAARALDRLIQGYSFGGYNR